MKTHLIPEPQLIEKNDSRRQTRPSLGFAAANESTRPATQGYREQPRRLPDMPMRSFLRVVFVR